MKELTLENLERSNACYTGIEYFKDNLADLKNSNEKILFCIERKYEVHWLIENNFIDKSHEKAILETGDAEVIYLFAKYVKGADINKCLNAILKSGNAYRIYRCVRDVQGADIKRCKEAILKTGNTDYINLFERDVEGWILKGVKMLFY